MKTSRIEIEIGATFADSMDALADEFLQRYGRQAEYVASGILLRVCGMDPNEAGMVKIGDKPASLIFGENRTALRKKQETEGLAAVSAEITQAEQDLDELYKQRMGRIGYTADGEIETAYCICCGRQPVATPGGTCPDCL